MHKVYTYMTDAEYYRRYNYKDIAGIYPYEEYGKNRQGSSCQRKSAVIGIHIRQFMSAQEIFPPVKLIKYHKYKRKD